MWFTAPLHPGGEARARGAQTGWASGLCAGDGDRALAAAGIELTEVLWSDFGLEMLQSGISLSSKPSD